MYDNHLINTLGLTKEEILTMYRDSRGIYDDYINEERFLISLQFLDINKVPEYIFEKWIQYVNYFIDYDMLPKEYKNKDAINNLLSITTKLKLDTMPKELWDKEIIMKYVNIISTNILDIHLELLSEELLEELIENDNNILE